MTDSSKKGLIKTLIIIGVIAGGFVATYFIICLAWNTNTPLTVVEGRSMEPTLYQGDLLFVKKPRNLGEIQNGSHNARTGDILIFQHPHYGYLIVHRVIDKNYSNSSGEWKWYFNTQGDNDVYEDDEDLYELGGDGFHLPEEYVKGIMIGRIPWIGNIGIFLRDSGIGILFIIIIIAYLVISSIYESKSEKDADISADSEKTEDESS